MRASSADGATGAMLGAVRAVPSAGQNPASSGKNALTLRAALHFGTSPAGTSARLARRGHEWQAFRGPPHASVVAAPPGSEVDEPVA